MGIGLELYRSTIGVFALIVSSTSRSRFHRGVFDSRPRKHSVLLLVVYLFLILRAEALPCHGDVERNPGPSTCSSPSPSPSQPVSSVSNSNSNFQRANARVGSSPGQRGKRHDASRSASLTVLQFNARSLLPKLSELRHLVQGRNPHLIAVTETWLNSSVPDGAVSLPGYGSVFRVDRKSRRGGGVLVLVRDDVKCQVRADLRVWPESVWLEVPLRRSQMPLLFCCIYRPPDSDHFAFAEDLESSMDVIDLQRSHVVMVGDLNATSPIWNSGDSWNAAGKHLQPTLLRLGLHQCVTCPTHLHNDGSLGSLLDVVLSSDPRLVTGVSTLPPVGSSDHLSVLCNFSPLLSPSYQPVSYARRLWKYDNVTESDLNKKLRLSDWSGVSAAVDVDSALSAWMATFHSVISKAVPSKIIKNIKPKNPYVTPDIEKAIKEKHALLRRLKRDPSEANKNAFKAQRNHVTHLLRKRARAFATGLHRQLRSTPSPHSSQSFWKYVRDLTGKTKNSIIPDLKDNSVSTADASSPVLATNPTAKANLLNSFFAQQTVLAGATTTHPDVTSLQSNDQYFSTLSCTPADVYQVLHNLKENKAPGHDQLPPRLLRLCAAGISCSLAVLFNRSFQEGCFPASWKVALVVPVFKKGDRSLPGNYRPIALLPILSKVMERIVCNKLSHFLAPWLSPYQSGFKKGDGTVAQLTRLIQHWSEALNNSQYVGIVFFDLKKAFDRVWHAGLLAKLHAAGVRGAAYDWLHSFLSNRRQATVIQGCTSSFETISAGVPQGAILSPLLFSVYVNDIHSCSVFDGNINLFADDTSAYVTSRSSTMLVADLQSTADRIAAWFNRWLLTANQDKTAVMVLRSRRVPAVDLSISLNGKPVQQVYTHRHLGVIFNEFLSWSDHIETIVQRASQRIGLLRRVQHQTSQLILRDIYLACVRPMLEYASVAWAGLSVCDCSRLERCNRSAARLIAHIPVRSQLPHQIILARAGLEQLSLRRSAACTVFAHKFICGSVPDHLSDAFPAWLPAKSATSLTLRNRLSVPLPRAKKMILKHSPLYIALSLWNALPPSVQSTATIKALNAFVLNS